MVFAHSFTTYDGIDYGFVPEPHGCGTFNILWTCLTTLFLCTWTGQHLNIPNPKDSRLKKLLRKVGWMIFTAIAPEYTTVNALYQYVQARRSVAAVKAQFGYEWWTMMHTYYALMGGLVVQSADGARYGFTWIDLRWLWQINVIDLSDMERKDIKDRSKADAMAKGFNCAQAAWFLIQIIGRLFQRLPFTTLEMSIIPLIGSTFLTYFFYWEKPLDLETTTTIMAPAITETHLAQLRARDPMWDQRLTPEQFKAQMIPNEFSTDQYDYKAENYHTTNLEGLLTGLVGTLLCAFHMAAVELQFSNLCRMHSVESMCIVCRGVSSPDLTDNTLPKMVSLALYVPSNGCSHTLSTLHSS